MVKKIQNIKEINSLLGSELLKILILCIFMRQQHRAFLIFFPLFFFFCPEVLLWCQFLVPWHRIIEQKCVSWHTIADQLPQAFQLNALYFCTLVEFQPYYRHDFEHSLKAREIHTLQSDGSVFQHAASCKEEWFDKDTMGGSIWPCTSPLAEEVLLVV